MEALHARAKETYDLSEKFISTKKRLVTAGLLTHELNHKIQQAKAELERCKKAHEVALEEQVDATEDCRVRLGRKQLTLSFCMKIQAIDLADLKKQDELSMSSKEDVFSASADLFTQCIEEQEKYRTV